jgi:hypothetical protein
MMVLELDHFLAILARSILASTVFAGGRVPTPMETGTLQLIYNNLLCGWWEQP